MSLVSTPTSTPITTQQQRLILSPIISNKHLITPIKLTSSKHSHTPIKTPILKITPTAAATPTNAKNSSTKKKHAYKEEKDEDFLIECITKLSLQSTPIKSLKKQPKKRNTPIGKNKKKSNCDRFIPNRQDLHMVQHQMSKSMKSADDTTGSLPTCSFNLTTSTSNTVEDGDELVYQYEIARACGLALDKKILSFSSGVNNQGVVKSYLSRPVRYKTKAAKRKIPTIPEKILDAPGIADDYYLNLLDWSQSNVLAVALGASVYLWNGSTGVVSELCCLEDESPEGGMGVASVSWSQDSSFVAVGGFDGKTRLWDVDSGTRVRTIVDDPESRISVSNWNRELLSTGSDLGMIVNHDVRIAQSRISQLAGHSGDICGLKWSMCGSQLASGGNDNLVNIWDIKTSTRPQFTKDEHVGAVKALSWCPWQSNLLASGGGTEDGRVMFWNTQKGSLNATIDTGSQITGLQWSKSYREILSSHGYSNNQLTLWKYPSLRKVIEIPNAHQSRILHSAMSPDGQVVCTAAADENLKFWRLFAVDPTHMRFKNAGGNSGLNKDSNSPNLGGLDIR